MDLGGFCWERVDWGFGIGILGFWENGESKCLGNDYMRWSLDCLEWSCDCVIWLNDYTRGLRYCLVDLWKTMWKTFWDWGIGWEIAWGSGCGKVCGLYYI
jgi:hypothetical protein